MLKIFNPEMSAWLKITIPLALLLGMVGCNDDSDSTSSGYLQLYNVSQNSPGLYLVIDDNDDDDEEIVGAVYQGKVSSHIELDAGSYDIEVAWPEDDELDDMTILSQTSSTIVNDTIELIVFAEDVEEASLIHYSIPVVSDDDDEDDELFNLRLLNLNTNQSTIDIYMSKADETFNESGMVAQLNYKDLTDNQKIDQDEYVFYITAEGSSEILYQSEEIDFAYVGQFILAVRENDGIGESPYTVDLLSHYALNYPDTNSISRLSVYNAVTQHEQIPEYSDQVDVTLQSVGDVFTIENIAFENFSLPLEVSSGDYSVKVSDSDSQSLLVENHLLSLEPNTDKTVFLYSLETEVDDDGDGDVDEDGDGVVDEYEVTLNSLVVENSTSESIYEHQIKVVNLIDDFSSVSVYFVKSNENIETADYQLSASSLSEKNIYLKNNSYNVYVIAKDNTTDLILSYSILTLDENSNEQFLVLDESDSSDTGYSASFFAQQRN
ncbi:DUF4397 domain-containing protein [Aliikangiella sp. G2MR2-5]|uniref:DUF4397 domain-containing protein n=1 Tax=Aliikangiella sp. G2MR2-5 TaxID=2788943 RepID=UPI0018AB8BFF|nr:DUF4397 domain-containing protein [Aliikangiella sp. G2MR2-5]